MTTLKIDGNDVPPSTVNAPAAVSAAPAASNGYAALAGRLLLAAIFLLSGFGKLADPAGTIAYIGSAGIPLASVAYAGTVLLELGAGLALVIGYRAGLAAIGLAAFTLLAAFLFHADLADQNQFIHFMKNIALAGGLLQVVAFGPGHLSVDARR